MYVVSYKWNINFMSGRKDKTGDMDGGQDIESPRGQVRELEFHSEGYEGEVMQLS